MTNTAKKLKQEKQTKKNSNNSNNKTQKSDEILPTETILYTHPFLSLQLYYLVLILTWLLNQLKPLCIASTSNGEKRYIWKLKAPLCTVNSSCKVAYDLHYNFLQLLGVTNTVLSKNNQINSFFEIFYTKHFTLQGVYPA